MAKYLVTSGSKFNPYSYEQLVQPLAQATEAHMAAQNAYDELASNAGSVGDLIGEGKGSEKSRGIYNDYMTALDNYVNDLSENGYGVNAMRGLSQMRKKYNKEITGLANAIERRRTLGDEYRKATVADPSLILEFNPAESGLDNWLDNPEYGTPKTISGKYLEQMVSQAAQNLKNTLNTRGQSEIAGGQYFQIADVTGATPQQIQEAKAIFLNNLQGGNAASGNPIVNSLVDIMGNAYANSGIEEWGESPAKDMARMKAFGYITNGINSALGQTKYDTLNNKAWVAQPTDDGGEGGDWYFRWNIGDAEYNGMKKKASRELDIDYNNAVSLRDAIQTGATPQISDAQYARNEAMRKALEDIENYEAFMLSKPSAKNHVERGKDIRRDNVRADYERLKSARDAAISNFPQLEGIKVFDEYPGTIVGTEQGIFRNKEFDAMKKSLNQSPDGMLDSWRKKYIPDNPNATIDDVIDVMQAQRKQRAKLERKAEAYTGGDNSNLAGTYGGYLRGRGLTEKNAGSVVTSTLKNGDVLVAADEALNDKESRWYLNPLGDTKKQVEVVDKYGISYYFSPDIFGAPIVTETLKMLHDNASDMTSPQVFDTMNALWRYIITESQRFQQTRSNTSKPF